MDNKVIGIIGTRRRDSEADYANMEAEFLKHYEEGDVICSGGCPKGGDRFAEVIAAKYSVQKVIFHADWKKFGKVAGFVRNNDIAENSDILIAMVSLDRTGGTEDTIKKWIDYHSTSKRTAEPVIL